MTWRRAGGWVLLASLGVMGCKVPGDVCQDYFAARMSAYQRCAIDAVPRVEVDGVLLTCDAVRRVTDVSFVYDVCIPRLQAARCETLAANPDALQCSGAFARMAPSREEEEAEEE